MTISIERGSTPVAWRLRPDATTMADFAERLRGLHDHRLQHGPRTPAGDCAPFYALAAPTAATMFHFDPPGISVQDIPLPAFEDRATKAALVEGVFKQVIQLARPRLFAWSSPVFWLREGTEGAAIVNAAVAAGEPVPRFDTLPGCEEATTVNVFGAGGETVGWARKLIARHDDGRLHYGPWREGSMHEGDMFDPVREAMR